MKLKTSKKGISPMIATVLLIAFTVAVAGIISVWVTTFTSSTTSTVSEKAEGELYCVYGGISVSSMKYCNNYFSGIVENTRFVDIGNVTLQVFYNNMSSKTVKLNISLQPRESAAFNLSGIDSNYDKIHMYTNCSNVYTDATKSDISTSC
jgi:flagellin-like protein